jgi:predicted acylesterase/phospholipase RssA
MRLKLLLHCAVAAAALRYGPAAAQIAAPGQEGTRPLGLSISGGISLGSYQAGVNWGLLEVFRRAASDRQFGRRLPVYRLSAVSGASAGNINTVLWAIEACTRRPQPMPADSSLFWQVWTGIGLDVMEAPTPSQRDTAMLDRGYMMDEVVLPQINARLEGGDLYRDCTVPAGITLTRIEPGVLWLRTQQPPDTAQLDLFPRPRTTDSLAIYTQRYATAFLVEAEDGRIRFRRPELSVGSVRRLGKVVVLADDNGEYGSERVFDAVKASSAFPVAFQPVRLRYRELDADHRTAESLQARLTGPLRNDLFMDGGVFDNNPVSLALELHGQSRRSKTPLDLLYVNPGNARGEPASGAAASAIRPGGLGATLRFGDGAVLTARQYEMQELVRDSTVQLRTPYRLLLTSRYAPIFGNHLSAFAAFIARPMREYDFYVGVYDALHFVADRYLCVGDVACVPGALRDLVATDQVQLGHAGHAVAAELYRDEFRRPLGVSAPLAASRGDSAKAELFRAFHRALPAAEAADSVAKTRAEAAGAEPRRACGNLLPGEYLLCRDGLLNVVYALILDPVDVYGLIEMIPDYCPATATKPCNDGLARLINNPARESERLVERFVARAPQVERAARGDSMVGPVKALVGTYWGYRIAATNRHGLTLDPSSIPDNHNVWHLAPFYVGANLGSSGYEVRWRPTYNRNPTIGFAMPVMLHHNNRVEHVEGERELYGGVGASLLVRRLPKIGALVNEVGIGVHAWQPLTDWGDPFLEGEVNARLIGGMLQVGWRPVFDDGRRRMHGTSSSGWSVGIADFNGLVYWINRMVRG